MQDVLEDVKLLRWRRVEDVLKTSSRPTNVCWGLCKEGLIEHILMPLHTHLEVNNIRATGVLYKNRLRKGAIIVGKQLQKKET